MGWVCLCLFFVDCVVMEMIWGIEGKKDLKLVGDLV